MCPFFKTSQGPTTDALHEAILSTSPRTAQDQGLIPQPRTSGSILQEQGNPGQDPGMHSQNPQKR
eukprot:9257242-Prorocentrum_lima.AAC.1